MSITGHLSGNPDKLFRKSLHRRKDSGELDVFEAARYFSGSNELPYTAATTYETSLFSQKIFREDHGDRRGGRMSLDLPIRTNVIPLPPPPYTAEKQSIKDQKKQRQQPSSPGGRLANFLNSLFNQSSSKKKKKPKNPIRNEDLHQEIGGKKRRSSLSTLIDSKFSSNSSKISGFRTPPAPNCCTVQTPSKNYKEIRSFLDQKRAANSSKNLGNGIDKKKSEMWRKINDPDEGDESDSSSDLFELRIYDKFDCYSSTELPVYQTTNIQTMNRL
ncbi:protein BIG GRAIN 1-like E [Benincasa hispida]|uniref:protein BIG GRAIN 1-like E n=1 Tax=Benincasa hispida TaxID=102211 RepID=UPI0019029A3B|nr:protein BIG GRAIN 1-like E [Benincasa hispida]